MVVCDRLGCSACVDGQDHAIGQLAGFHLGGHERPAGGAVGLQLAHPPADGLQGSIRSSTELPACVRFSRHSSISPARQRRCRSVDSAPRRTSASKPSTSILRNATSGVADGIEEAVDRGDLHRIGGGQGVAPGSEAAHAPGGRGARGNGPRPPAQPTAKGCGFTFCCRLRARLSSRLARVPGEGSKAWTVQAGRKPRQRQRKRADIRANVQDHTRPPRVALDRRHLLVRRQNRGGRPVFREVAEAENAPAGRQLDRRRQAERAKIPPDPLGRHARGRRELVGPVEQLHPVGLHQSRRDGSRAQARCHEVVTCAHRGG